MTLNRLTIFIFTLFLFYSCKTTQPQNNNTIKDTGTVDSVTHPTDQTTDYLTDKTESSEQKDNHETVDTTKDYELYEPPVYAEGATAVNNTNYLNAILNLIKGAQKSIRLCELEFHDDSTVAQIKNYLFQAKKRGVDIKILLDDSPEDNAAAVNKFKSAGITNVKLDPNTITTHVKMIIVDNKYVMLGSTNCSYMSIKYNNETNALINNIKITAYFNTYFEKLWSNPYKMPQIDDPDVPDLMPIIDKQYYKKVAPIIKSAQKHINLLMYAIRYYPDYPDSDSDLLIKDLEKAAQNDVKVRVILEHSDWNPDMNEANKQVLDMLKSKGVETCFESDKTISHAKLLLTEDSAVVASNNWSYSGLDKNHEVGIIIKNSPSITKYHSYFDKIWQNNCE